MPTVPDAEEDKHFYHVSDRMGTVYALLGQNAGLAMTYNYDPYGRPTFTTAGPANAAANLNVFRYTGREATFTNDYKPTEDWPGSLEGFYHYRSRNYLPHLGQFNRMDEVWTANRYGYVEGNPVLYIDPFGYECDDAHYNAYKDCYQTYAAMWEPIVVTAAAFTAAFFVRAKGLSVLGHSGNRWMINRILNKIPGHGMVAVDVGMLAAWVTNIGYCADVYGWDCVKRYAKEEWGIGGGGDAGGDISGGSDNNSAQHPGCSHRYL
jgi:RHS repeat-associated protein